MQTQDIYIYIVVRRNTTYIHSSQALIELKVPFIQDF